ncbi:helicase C-terminal domain-containing protein [Enhygromyxa salina]|uniref:Bifunctional ATP-dependent DNA helicase/DNA polymerase III subunit epsilon n=1 Tax=Enhygromyxa salina TaxID=215803 RepID=A0A2S9YTT5_9BACT|nr:helicase C-terminal domain-containing protein [Enhygromyxa salina]PRQ08449.1 bifunctional ATP-dependent DNA helicase/DNA polymerase III subunit epsilon [Enhygromyxa salina]
MRYDEQRQTLELSVHEVVADAQPRALVAPAFARLRAELGRVVHRRVQRDLAPGQTEVPVRLEREVDGVQCLVRGRADVVRRLAAGCLVEEIKSTFDLDGRDDRPAAVFQVQLYALALAEEGNDPVRARLVIVEVEGDGTREIDVPFAASDRMQVERRLTEVLARHVAQARALEARARARKEAADTIEFPFAQLRTGQQAILDAVAQALALDRPVMLSAPTGTGKTAVALVPALREGLRRGAAVWYLTAKTTQRQHAADTFEAVRRASGSPSLRAVVTRRKQDMCPPGHLRCHPRICPLLADFTARAEPVIAALKDQPLVSPDQLFERGRATTLCPYELMHALLDGADLVVADHSHVYDPRRSRAFEGRRLVIVDEAHNLVDRARDSASVFVGRRLSALEHAPVMSSAMAQLRRDVQRAIDDALQQAAADERPAHEGRATAELDVERWQQLGLEAGMLALRYGYARYLSAEVEAQDPVLEAIEAISYLGDLAADPDPALVGYLASADAPTGAGVGVLCLDPERRLERLHQRQAGVLVMSATLEPIDYFADMLGLSRLDPAVISAPSTFPAENCCVCLVPTVRTTFDERDDHAQAIAMHIAEVIAAKPGNYAAFFSSFRYLATVSRLLDARALGTEVLIQPPGMNEALRTRYLDRLRRADTPTLLLAVTGGVFAEGIDLPDEGLIGAIIVGPALPALSFERLLMQSYQDQRREAGFAYAMAYPAMQRVVQAAGRVHRTPEDRGVIVLLGGRFAEPPYSDALPSRWYERGADQLITVDLRERLRRFWGRPH